MTEARRIAKNIIKDMMKRDKIKVSHVPAAEITKAANALLAVRPELVTQAEQSLAERKAIKIDTAQFDIGQIKIDPKLVAKAEADKQAKKKDKPLSATQAGKVAPRKPTPTGKVVPGTVALSH